MFKIFGEHYYIDLDAIDEFTRIDDEKKSYETETENVDSNTKVHIVKYEMIKYMLTNKAPELPEASCKKDNND